MAHLAVVGSHTVNGVAQIHSDIIKSTIFKDFHGVFPLKFQNKTNGVTPRRWLVFCNTDLAALITEALGTKEWMTNCKLLEGLKPFAEDAAFRKKWTAVKRKNKERLGAKIRELTGDDVDTSPMFDIQVMCSKSTVLARSRLFPMPSADLMQKECSQASPSHPPVVQNLPDA